jgi:predicted permease
MELGSSLFQDLRYGLRLLAKERSLTAIAVLTLALGIGANSAIFSIVSAIMLRSLPVEDPQHLAVLRWSANHRPQHIHGMSSYGDTQENFKDVNPTGSSFPRPFYEEVKRSGQFSDVAGFASAGSIAFSGNGAATSVRGESVTGNFFSVLGIHPAAGRLIAPSDDDRSAPPVIVLNYKYWQKAFGGSPSAIGKVVKLNNVPFTIVGVAEPKFLALSFGNVYDLWIPLSFRPVVDQNPYRRRSYDDPLSWWLLIIGRDQPGATAERAQAALNVLFHNFTEHAGDKPTFEAKDNANLQVVPAQTALVGESPHYTDPLRVMTTAVGFVLLIACANVAGLMLARATARQGEIAVRLALGAARARLLRQLLTESVLLALFGGVLGIVIAFWGSHAIVSMIGSTDTRPLGFTAELDWRVLAFTATVSLLTGIVFGIAPAMRSLHLDLTPALKSGTQSSGARPASRHRWFSLGNALVAVQAALAIVVLMGAGLLVHTLKNLKDLNPGFDTRNLLTFNLNPQQAGYKNADTEALYHDLQDRIEGIPGVMSVSYSGSALLAGSWSRTGFRYVPPGGSKRVEVEADIMDISPEFFSTLKIPFLSGRNFNGPDFERANLLDTAQRALMDARAAHTAPPEMPSLPMPAIINSQFAKKYLAGVNALGQRFGSEDGSDPDRPKDSGYEVIGIVGDAKYNSLRRDIDPTMYVPLTGSPAAFEVRTAGDPKAMIAPIRSLIDQRDSNLPMMQIATQSEQIDRLLAQERIVAQLSSFFGVLALLLACTGLYGLLSYEVTRRTREIGIRVALGAQRMDLIRMVVGQGIVLSLAGTVVGLVAAFGIGKLLKSLLYGVKPGDPITLVAVSVLVIGIALAAAFVPARRATTVNPVIALRYE